MKCQRCPKQATLHITEVLGEDRFEEVHLCEDCAKKYLYEPQKKQRREGRTGEPRTTSMTTFPPEPAAPACGMTVPGVPQPRPVRLPARLRRLQGRTAAAHGERPRRRAARRQDAAPAARGPRPHRRELAQLRQQLQTLVTEENYEEAARVRDQIKNSKRADVANRPSNPRQGSLRVRRTAWMESMKCSSATARPRFT